MRMMNQDIKRALVTKWLDVNMLLIVSLSTIKPTRKNGMGMFSWKVTLPLSINHMLKGFKVIKTITTYECYLQ